MNNVTDELHDEIVNRKDPEDMTIDEMKKELAENKEKLRDNQIQMIISNLEQIVNYLKLFSLRLERIDNKIK